jgi:hypothetical protein
MGEFKDYGEKLDKLVSELPNWGQYRKIQDEAWEKEHKSLNAKEIFANFNVILKNILECLGTKDIKEYHWHDYIAPMSFKVKSSKYFRLGSFGQCENVPVTENLQGTIAIGFDECGNYENEEGPELVIFYENDDHDFVTDIDLYNPKNWRNALHEFFIIPEVK